MKKVVLRFNAHPAGTLGKVVGLANSAGVVIDSIQDITKTKKIILKVVTIRGDDVGLTAVRRELKRLPAVTLIEE